MAVQLWESPCSLGVPPLHPRPAPAYVHSPVPAQCREHCWPGAVLSYPALRSPEAQPCTVWCSAYKPASKLHCWEHCSDSRNWNWRVGFACVATSTEVTVLRVNTMLVRSPRDKKVSAPLIFSQSSICMCLYCGNT